MLKKNLKWTEDDFVIENNIIKGVKEEARDVHEIEYRAFYRYDLENVEIKKLKEVWSCAKLKTYHLLAGFLVFASQA